MTGFEYASQMDWELISLHKQCMTRMLSSHRLHIGQPQVLLTLGQMDACKQAELARALRVSPATITVSVGRLERSGLVRRVPDPNDLRSNRIELTDEGRDAAIWAEQAIQLINAQKYAGFTDSEFSQLERFYRRMQQNLINFRQELDGQEEHNCEN